MSRIHRSIVVGLAASGMLASLMLASPAGAASPSAEFGTPTAPTITAVGPGTASGQIVVSYAPPASDGGTPVTRYEISINAGVNWWVCAPSPGLCTLTSLDNGRSYSVVLRAVNAVGAGPSSTPMIGVLPIPPGYDPDKPARLPTPVRR